MTDTPEQLRRLVSSYKTLTDAQANQLNVLKDRLYTLRGADKALDSEREANALLTEQLAASQSREQKLRAAINSMAGETTSHYDRLEIARKALSLPQDTSALEAMIQKAGEVMRARCAVEAYEWAMAYVVEDTAPVGNADAIRALPSVTLEDLKNG